MLNPSKVKSNLKTVINDAELNVENFVNSPGKDMTRKRVCPFKDIVYSILSFGNQSLNKEIEKFFSGSRSQIPRTSSFVKQRAKLNDKLFPYIFYQFNSMIPLKKKYKGLHVFGADGSDVNLPTDRSDHTYFIPFRRNIEGDGYWQIHINALYDLLEQRYVDVCLEPRPKYNEPAALCEIVDRFPSDEPAVFIADRNYPRLNLLMHIIEKGHFFLIRSCDPYSSSSFLKHTELPQSGEFDVDIELLLTRSCKKKYLKHPEKYRCLRKRAFDLIPFDDKESVYPMPLRVVCIKIGDDNYEYLLTNLPRDKFPPSDLKELYSLRWGIESSFRALKYALSLTKFHSVKREFIIQEIYARLTMYNFTSLLTKTVVGLLPSKKKGNKHDYAVSFSDAVSVARDLLLGKILNEEVKRRLLKNTVPIRPGRKAERKVKTQSAKSLNYRG